MIGQVDLDYTVDQSSSPVCLFKWFLQTNIQNRD